MKTEVEKRFGPFAVAQHHGLTIEFTRGDAERWIKDAVLIEGQAIPEWAVPVVTADDGWPRFLDLTNRAWTMVDLVDNPEKITIAVDTTGFDVSNEAIRSASRISFAVQAVADLAMLVEIGLKKLCENETGSYKPTHDLLNLYERLELSTKRNVDQQYEIRAEGKHIKPLLERHRHDRDSTTYLGRQRTVGNRIMYEPRLLRSAAEAAWVVFASRSGPPRAGL